MTYDRTETYRVMGNMKQVGYDLGKRIQEMMTPPNGLSETQMLMLDKMIERRIANTNDTRREAIQHIINYLKQNDNINN